MGHRPRTWRLIACIREMADLGCGGAETARMLGVSAGLVFNLACRYGISFTVNRIESPIRRAIREGYAEGLSPAEIAYELNTSSTSVRSLACRMGLTETTVRDPFKHKRPFTVPAERMAEYKSLRKLGMTITECGHVMGFLARPSAKVAA